MIDAREMTRKLVLAGARYSGASTLASPFLSGAGAILMLHRVTAERTSPLGINRHLAVSPAFLDRALADVKRRGMALVSLDELLDALRTGRPRRLVAITADDAYLDNWTEALPVLEAHEAPFTVYVAPGLISGEVLPWWEIVEETVASREIVYLPTEAGVVALDCGDAQSKRLVAARIMRYVANEVPEAEQQALLARIGAGKPLAGKRRFMTWEELRALSTHRLATIGAHTVHHYNLKRLGPDVALREMVDSATIIEIETGRRPRHFAFPYGYESAVGPREVELAREAGFASAVTTRHGVLQHDHAAQPHALPRISVNGNYQRLGYLRTLLSGITTPLSNGGRRFVTV